MRAYKCLRNNSFTLGEYTLVPLRDEDKYRIMQWRNEQIEILRQKEPLTKSEQEHYFATVVDNLFEVDKPNQLLFSYLKKGELIGYGGLVHIDWDNRNAEISFLLETERSNGKEEFVFHWSNYLQILKKVAFEDVFLKRIYTYAYDMRPLLYKALESEGFIEEQRLKNEIEVNGHKYDVVIHSFICNKNLLSFRKANWQDKELYFTWANDEDVRKQSFHSEKISLENHLKWFEEKVGDEHTLMLVFYEDKTNENVGQVRVTSGNENIIGISIDKKYRGKSYASYMIYIASKVYKEIHTGANIFAYIKIENVISAKSFVNAGYKLECKLQYNSTSAYKYVY